MFSVITCRSDDHLSNVLMKMPLTQHARTTKSHRILHWQRAPHEQDARPQLKLSKDTIRKHNADISNDEWKKIRVPNTFILIQTLIKIYNKFWPVASFLWPLKTWSSSFRLRMSKSLQRWSREAVSSQLPFRFSFTSMTVFLWACLQAENKKRLFVHILTSQTQIKYDYLPVPNIQVNVSNSGY